MLVSRRTIGAMLGAAAVPLGTARAATPALDLTTPESKLTAWLKVYVSLAKARIWYWYTGTIDATVPGGPVVPLFGVSTLIRRDVTPLGNARFEVEMFEGSYFHGLDDAKPLDHWRNPLNGRDVRPFHYREGPYRVGYDPRGAFDADTRTRYPGAPSFATRWQRAGDRTWFSRDYYIDVPHPLPMAQWPLESSGARQTTGSFATHWANYAEVADPRVMTAASDFHYEAVMDWLPWMLMGQAPGRMVWRAAGAKLASIAQLPPPARAAFKQTHPRLFDDRPWEDHVTMFSDFVKMRTPMTR